MILITLRDIFIAAGSSGVTLLIVIAVIYWFIFRPLNEKHVYKDPNELSKKDQREWNELLRKK